jgi:hypothetical protein
MNLENRPKSPRIRDGRSIRDVSNRNLANQDRLYPIWGCLTILAIVITKMPSFAVPSARFPTPLLHLVEDRPVARVGIGLAM